MEGYGECRGVCGEDGGIMGGLGDLLDCVKAMFPC